MRTLRVIGFSIVAFGLVTCCTCCLGKHHDNMTKSLNGDTSLDFARLSIPSMSHELDEADIKYLNTIRLNRYHPSLKGVLFWREIFITLCDGRQYRALLSILEDCDCIMINYPLGMIAEDSVEYIYQIDSNIPPGLKLVIDKIVGGK